MAEEIEYAVAQLSLGDEVEAAPEIEAAPAQLGDSLSLADEVEAGADDVEAQPGDFMGYPKYITGNAGLDHGQKNRIWMRSKRIQTLRRGQVARSANERKRLRLFRRKASRAYMSAVLTMFGKSTKRSMDSQGLLRAMLRIRSVVTSQLPRFLGDSPSKDIPKKMQDSIEKDWEIFWSDLMDKKPHQDEIKEYSDPSPGTSCKKRKRSKATPTPPTKGVKSLHVSSVNDVWEINKAKHGFVNV